MNATRRPTQIPRLRGRLARSAVAAAVTLLATPAGAQWVTESPLPTHLNVEGIAAPATGRLFLATTDDPFDEGGALFESADGGANWTQRDVPFGLGDSLHGIVFRDELNGWTWGNANYRTTDGGTTWEEMEFLGSTDFMRFYTPTFGLATGNFGAYVSGDAGVTWTPSPDGMSAFSFADDLIGLGVADTGIYRTVDGGVTFTPVHAGDAVAVTFLSSTVAVAIVDGAFARSTDGGVTWATGVSAEERRGLLAIDASVVLAWGRSGAWPDYDDRLLRSADGGATWTDLGEVIDPGASTVPFTFALPAPQIVVVSDGAGNLYRSTDAGLTWAQTFATPGPYPYYLGTSTPVFVDGATGYFGMGSGFVLETTDGGASWSQLSSGTATSLDDLDRFGNGGLIAVGDSGEVLTRGVGGPPWLIRGRLGAEDLVAVQVVGPQEVVTVDSTGVVHRSADGGATWTAGAPLPLALTAKDLHFETLLEGWVVGWGFQGAALFHTTDGGAAWTPVTDFQGPYQAVDFEGASGWAVADDGTLQLTTDGGVTWTEGQLPGAFITVRHLDFHDAAVGYAVGESGYAARSGDGGLTWDVLPTPDATHALTDLFVIGADELWASTAGGAALYSATGGQNWALLDAGENGFGIYETIAATPAGEAWMAGSQGTVRRFVGPPPPPVNQPPNASFDFLATGLEVAFTDTSADNDGTIVGWQWDFGDGATASDQHPTHLFSEADTYHVTLTVTDDDGDTDSALQFVVVQPGPGGIFGDFTEVTPLDPLFVTPQDEDFWVVTTAPADYDGDGDLDIAVFGYYVVYGTSVEELLVLLRNDGPAADDEWEFTYFEVPLDGLTAGASDLAWGDVDGDGDEDLAVGSDGQTVIYRNDGGTLTPSDTVLPGYWEDNGQADFDLSSITWADYDNDGDLDLLLPSVWDPSAFTYRTALMRNDGSNGTGGWSFTEVEAGFSATTHAQSVWADFDADQDLDLLLVNLAPLTDEGFIRRYRNDGGGVFVGEDVLGSLTVEHGAVQWGDYDDDGDLDILVAGHVKEVDDTFDSVLRVYRNDDEVWEPVEVLPCPGCDGWTDLTAAWWADYDSDGDVDILLAGSYNSGSQIEGRAIIYANDAGTFTPLDYQLPAPRASGTRGGTFSWLDIDGEGDLDYFIAGQYFVPGGNGLVEAQMHLYRNDAAGENQPPSAPSMLESQVYGDGSVALWWNPAGDDSTPPEALTYDVRIYRDGLPLPPQPLPEAGKVGPFAEWTLLGLEDGSYTWRVRAVDSAYNSGPLAEGTFTVGGPPPDMIFEDGFESGGLTRWIVEPP